MDFSFSDLERSFRDGAVAVLSDLCTPAAVRSTWDTPARHASRATWDALAGLGVLDALVPEDEGGLGLDERAVVLVFEEAGRFALPDPIVETSIAAPLLGADRVGSGLIVASNLGSGSARDLVPWGADADLLVLAAEDGSVHAIAPSAVRMDPVDAVDRSRRITRIGWEPAPSSRLEVNRERVDQALDRGALTTAAVLIGLAERMLELTVSYVKERVQFGKPVGSFQALKHRLADAAVEIEFARPAVYRAAWSLATGSAASRRDVSMAKAMASDAALVTARAGLQCHGAIGYTTENDLQLYMKRAWALAQAFGDAHHHRSRVGRAIGV